MLLTIALICGLIRGYFAWRNKGSPLPLRAFHPTISAGGGSRVPDQAHLVARRVKDPLGFSNDYTTAAEDSRRIAAWSLIKSA